LLSSRHSSLRVLIHWIVTKKLFDMFIMLVIVLSSIALASEDPVDEDSPRNLLLGYADYGFTAIFTLECTLKVRPRIGVRGNRDLRQGCHTKMGKIYQITIKITILLKICQMAIKCIDKKLI
jgi:hypothetical protein